MAAKDRHFSRKRFVYYIIVMVAMLLISSIFFAFIPSAHKTTIAISVITVIILPGILAMILKKEKRTPIAILSLTIVFLSSGVALANPDFSIFNIIHDSNTAENAVVHDKDFIKATDESDAIESVIENIDNSVFEMFYQFSYIRNGQIDRENITTEEMKIDFIADMVIDNMEQYGLETYQYTNEELNSGKYSELTQEANKAEEEYRKDKESRDTQANILSIENFLQIRKEAYFDKKTAELARLIGNTYAELATHQVVNNNIVSNCKAIKYYIESCQLSDPATKSAVFYEIGIRFNCISEIAREVSMRENSNEYKQLFIDSLYMSTAYYKLFRDGFVKDYKNNYYLARNYKLLGDTLSDNSSKIFYYEKAINILHTLEDYEDLSNKSKESVCKSLYTTLNAYKNVPESYWNRYNCNLLDEEIQEKQKEQFSYQE